MSWWSFLVADHGPFYGLTSGWLGDVEGIGGLAAVGSIWATHVCHERRCYRPGRHPAAGGTFRYCARHHPDAHPDTGFDDRDHRHRLHREWKARNHTEESP